MDEVGVDLIVTPYRGRAIESPWWRTAPNPLYREAETFAAARDARRAAERRHATCGAPKTSPDDTRADKAVARGDLALRHAALAAAPRAHPRARTRRRRGRSSSPCRWRTSAASRLAARALRRAGRVLRRRRADEPAGVRRHGHGLQLLPRCRSVGVRPRALQLRRRARPPARARCAPRGGASSGPPIRSCSSPPPWRRSTTSSSTATATSSGASGCRSSSASRAARARDRLRARRSGLPRRHRQRAA